MKNKAEAGFTYIDVIAGMLIMLVGILALVSAISWSIFQSKGQQQQLYAKQIASSTMESIMSVKETDLQVIPIRLGWTAVGNIGSNLNAMGNPQGIFLTGFQPVRTDAGPDQIIGTFDDTGAVVPGFQRRIIITDQCDFDRPSPNCTPPGTFPVRIRTVEVTITYFVGSVQKQERLTTVLTNYAIT